MAARGASAAFGGFGFALKTAATFDVFYWLEVTNYGVLYVLFDSAPSGSNYIDVWDLCLHAQTVSPIISSQRFSGESRREQAEKLFARVRKSCAHNQSPIAIRLARFKLPAHLSREFSTGRTYVEINVGSQGQQAGKLS